MHRLALCAALLAGCAGSGPEAGDGAARVLVYTNANGWVHQSIPAGVEALAEIGEGRGFEVVATDDSLAFRPDDLAEFAAVVFLSTSGDVLGPEQEAAFEAYVEGGGGYVGVHSASDTEYDWPWYGRLVGAYFESHPPVQEATLTVAEADHPATRALPETWVRTDEWYDFRSAPEGVTVLLRLDEATYEGGTMGADHPAAWAHPVGEGRAVYTALGHTTESYAEAAFRDHLGGAVCWAARLPCADG